MEGHRNSLLALTLLVLCLQNAFPSAEGFRNFDLEEALHVNIRSGLEDALHPSTKLTKIEDIIDPVSLSKLEISIHDFVDECKARNKSLDLSTLLQVNKFFSKSMFDWIEIVRRLYFVSSSLISFGPRVGSQSCKWSTFWNGSWGRWLISWVRWTMW